MKASLVAIAKGKNRDASAAPLLDRIEHAVAALEAVDAALGERIRAGKAARGADPVKLSRTEHVLLARLERDHTQGEIEVAGQLAALASAQEVIEALAFGLENHLQAESATLKHCPAEERPLFQELSALKKRALETMREYLARARPKVRELSRGDPANGRDHTGPFPESTRDSGRRRNGGGGGSFRP